MKPSQAPSDAAIGCNETGACTDVTDTEVWRTLLAVYLGAILFLSVTINGTLCLVFYKKQHLLNISNCFVLNLACCHLVMSVLIIPCTFYATVSHGTVYSGPWCDIQGFVFTAIMVTVQLALLAISLDRNYAIMNSLRYPTVFTQKLCTIMIVFSWVIGVILSFPPLLDSGLGTYKFHKYQFICTLDWSGTSPYLIMFHVFSFMLPILVQSFCYLKIFKAALGHTKKSMRVYPWVTSSSVKTVKDTASDSSESVESIDSEDVHRGATQYKAVRTIFLIALAYCVCWVPYLTESYLVHTRGVFFPNLSAASICLVFSAGLLNPVIYAYMNRVTRREIGRFLCGTPMLNDSDDFVSTSMSTYSSAKQSASVWAAQQRMRSRSAGGLNEMDTILEEAEDSQICETRSVGNMPIGETTLADHFTQTSPACSKQHGEIIQVFQVNDKVATNNDSKSVIESGTLHAPSTSSGKRTLAIESIPRRASDSAWNVIHTEKFVAERRRVSRNGLEKSYSKEKRRKPKDYGSFLFFDQDETVNNGRKWNRDKRLRKCRSQRLSVDHTQKVSITSLPKLFKFRFSVSDIDDQIQKVTVRSNVEIKNKPATPCVEIDQESSSCDPFSPVFDEIPSQEPHGDGKNKTHEETIQSAQCKTQFDVTDLYMQGHSFPVSPGHVCTDVWGQNAGRSDVTNDIRHGGLDTLDYDDVFTGSRALSTRRSV